MSPMKVQSAAIQKDLEIIEKIKAKQAYKARKAQEMEIQLTLVVQESEEKAKVREQLEKEKAAQRKAEAEALEVERKAKAAKRLEEMKAHEAAVKVAAEERQKIKEAREIERVAAMEEKRVAEALEREKAAAAAKERFAAVKVTEERERKQVLASFEATMKLAEEKLVKFRLQQEEKRKENAERAIKKQADLEAAIEYVRVLLEKRKTDADEKERLLQIRLAEAAVVAAEQAKEKERLRKEKAEDQLRKKIHAAELEQERIREILKKRAEAEVVLEKGRVRREAEIVERQERFAKKFQLVEERVEKHKIRKEELIANLRAEAEKKKERCEFFLDQKAELLSMRGVMRHDMLKEKAGWSLLSTAAEEKEKQAEEFAKLKAKIEEERRQEKEKEGNEKTTSAGATGRSFTSPSSTGKLPDVKSLTGTVKSYTLAPYKIPPLPTSQKELSKQRAKQLAEREMRWNDYVPRVPKSFDAAYSAVSTPDGSPRGMQSIPKVKGVKDATLHLGLPSETPASTDDATTNE